MTDKISAAAGRRWRWAAGVAFLALLAVGGVAGAAVSGAFGGGGSSAPDAAGSQYRTSTVVVARRSLTSKTEVDATLGKAGAFNVVDQAQGTFTSLPPVGKVVRQGHVLYEVSGSPVVLLYGSVPAWRALFAGVTGPDVLQLNRDLVKLGYATVAALGPRSGWSYFSAETAYAVGLLQTHLGVTATGKLALGQAVFLPGRVQISALGTGVVLGGAAQAGTVAMTATSTTPVVTINLDAAQQSEVKAGDRVSITLPDGRTTPGVVSSVSRVAHSASSSTGDSGSSGDSGNSSDSASSDTISVRVALSHARAARGLDQAPVTVAITTGRVSDVLVVPVAALLARPGGGFAVEVASQQGHHLVTVSPGLFDDAAGLVQVSGSGLAAGQRVVVPGI
jgi:hypothetical protein